MELTFVDYFENLNEKQGNNERSDLIFVDYFHTVGRGIAEADDSEWDIESDMSDNEGNRSLTGDDHQLFMTTCRKCRHERELIQYLSKNKIVGKCIQCRKTKDQDALRWTFTHPSQMDEFNGWNDDTYGTYCKAYVLCQWEAATADVLKWVDAVFNFKARYHDSGAVGQKR